MATAITAREEILIKDPFLASLFKPKSKSPSAEVPMLNVHSKPDRNPSAALLRCDVAGKFFPACNDTADLVTLPAFALHSPDRLSQRVDARGQGNGQGLPFPVHVREGQIVPWQRECRHSSAVVLPVRLRAN